MLKNLGQKGLTKVVKICVKITLDFVSKGSNGVKRGNMVLKWGVKTKPTDVGRCIPALAGLRTGYFRSVERDELLAGALR
jgi:hypothetical protein